MDGTTVFVLIVIFVATLIRSVFGFGEALVAVPLLALRVPVHVAAPLAVLVSITVAGVIVAQDWRKIHVRSTGWLLFPTLFGIPLGLLLLTSGNHRLVKAALALGYHVVLGVCADRPKASGVAQRQPTVASHLRILCGRDGRCLRNERATPGNLRSDAPLVGPALPRDAAGIFPAGQHHWHGRILAGRSLGPRRNPLLPDVAAPHPWRRCYSEE